jgi:hypothetical protein
LKNFLFYILTTLSVSLVQAQTDSVIFTSSNLPVFVIDTKGQVIVDEPKIIVNLGIIYNGEGVRNNINGPFNHYNGRIAMEIRGASSQMFPKKQYSFETIDSSGAEIDISLLGFPSESDWILYAPYSDKSLVRNVLAYKLSNNIGRYASRSKFCELILDGKYMGVYVLLEKIKRNKSRVNISKLTNEDRAGDDLTGGYIIKIDKLKGRLIDGWYSTFPPYPSAWQKIYFQYHYPNAENIVDAQKNYIQNFINSFETKMYEADFADSIEGYAKLIDVGSFIDFFILNELSKNVDSYRLSTFLYKDKNSIYEKLKAGPIWDYNIGFGNCYYQGANLKGGWHIDYETYNPAFLLLDYWQVPFWWKKLFGDPDFKVKIALRWQQLRSDEFSTTSIFSVIDSLTVLLDESQQRNFIRWPVLGQSIWPNAYVGQTYYNEINYLKNWISQRIDWMDAELSKIVEVDVEENELLNNFSLSQNYPNPFNPNTTINFVIPKSSFVNLKVYDALGRETAILVNEERPAGEYEVEFNPASGIENLPAGRQGLASGIYFYKLQTESYSSTKKMIYLR